MRSIEERFSSIGIGFKDILLPKKNFDHSKWAVVACDQYTSQKDYWERVKEYVGSEPSTLKLIFPECYLNDGDEDNRIAEINKTMNEYLKEGVFRKFSRSFVLVERRCDSGTRWGLIVPLDLEKYSWEVGAKSLIRPTEETIVSRIPPRKKIRKDAAIEFPHIIVLISDPKRKIIEPLRDKNLEQLYSFSLMENGGHMTAWLVNQEEDLKMIADGFEELLDSFTSDDRMLYAMGDGNHSLATAKSCWEDIKKTIPKEEWKDHPARYALVEIENIFDNGLVFEPVHRVFFDLSIEEFEKELAKTCSSWEIMEDVPENDILQEIELPNTHRFGLCTSEGNRIYSLIDPKLSIPAGSIQSIIDSLAGKKEMDYVHGFDVTMELGSKPGNIGIFLPSIPKDSFFSSILKDGVLPRKTFSLGEANEKRFYMEGGTLK